MHQLIRQTRINGTESCAITDPGRQRRFSRVPEVAGTLPIAAPAASHAFGSSPAEEKSKSFCRICGRLRVGFPEQKGVKIKIDAVTSAMRQPVTISREATRGRR